MHEKQITLKLSPTGLAYNDFTLFIIIFFFFFFFFFFLAYIFNVNLISLNPIVSYLLPRRYIIYLTPRIRASFGNMPV